MRVRLQDGEVCFLRDSGERVVSADLVATYSAVWFCYADMIKSSKDKEAEKIFNLKPSRKLPQYIQVRTHRKLLMVNSADRIDDLRNPPSNHLEKLKGDRKDEWIIKINDQWRVCFKFDETTGDASDVIIEDYH